MNLIKKLLYVTAAVSCLGTDVDFFSDFFRDKQGAIFMCNTYWGRSELLEVLKSFEGRSIKIRTYTDKQQIFLKRLHNMYFIVDARNWGIAHQILYKFQNEDIFKYPLKMLIVTDEQHFQILNNLLTHLSILPHSELVIGISRNDSVEMLQPYKVADKREIVWEIYGNWTQEMGLQENYKYTPTSRRRMNLRRAHLYVGITIMNNDTLNHLTDFREPGVDTYTKQHYGSLQCTLEFINSTYSIKITPRYGYYDSVTNEFDGLVGMLAHNDIDISASMFLHLGREKYVDFIYAGNHYLLRFIVRKPSTSYMKNIFFVTFTSHVWFALLIILIIFAIAIRIVLNLEEKHQKINKKTKLDHQFSISDVVLIALESLCQQGTTTDPGSLSGRIITLIFFGALMFLYVSYSANIVVLLQSTTTLNNLKELLNSRIQVAGHNTDYMKDYFEAPKDGILYELYEKKIYPNNYIDSETGMKILQKESFAFHISLQTAYNYILYNFTNYETCGLQELPGYIENNAAYVGMPKKSPYKEIFRISVLRIFESGIQQRFDLRIIRKPKCYSQSASFKSVGIYDCHQVFWIWIIGTTLSIIIMILEKLTKITCNTKKFQPIIFFNSH